MNRETSRSDSFLARRFSDPLVRYIVLNWLIGMATGVVGALIVLALNPLGFRTLLWSSPDRYIALALLFGGFIVTFGGVVCAAAVMNLARDDDDDDRGGGPGLLARLLPPPPPALRLARATVRR
ncbi:MAG: hypothetical protein KGL46_02620 [Hyphomicrobiales bacterium]|nr:hypothetical protein [Hyphomicrobiales bacterium]